MEGRQLPAGGQRDGYPRASFGYLATDDGAGMVATPGNGYNIGLRALSICAGVQWTTSRRLSPSTGLSRPIHASSPQDRTTMQEINPITNLIKDLSERAEVLRGYL
jgi:hypothetical protein